MDTKQDRPGFRAYRTHFYRQTFGRSLSAKPITDRYGKSYAILNSAPYKLFWIIFIPLVFIITISQGLQFGIIPVPAVIGLYFIVSAIRYFTARFVKLEYSEYIEDIIISYEMCDKASRDERPPFSAYLKYLFIPARSRYKHIIEDEDGRKYYQIQRRYNPEAFFYCTIGYFMFKVGDVMGIGILLISWLAVYGLLLLVSPLYLYHLRFNRIDDKDIDDKEYNFLHDDESTSLSYKIFSGIFIAAGLAVFALGIILIGMRSFKHEIITPPQSQTIVQAYDYAAEYALERLEKADLVGFYIKYKDMNAMQSGEQQSNWSITFQGTPGLLPRPNETMEFSNDYSIIRLYHHTYETIRPVYDAGLVTDPSKILAILKSNAGIPDDTDISSIVITTPDFSIFRIHDPYECKVTILMRDKETKKYIVNLRDRTARLE